MSDSSQQPAATADRTVHEIVMTHLDSAYRLARWILRDEHEAEDAVQEAALRALRYSRTFAGGNARAWFFRIVRNTCFELRKPWRRRPQEVFDEQHHSTDSSSTSPEQLLLRADEAARLRRAIDALPDRFRELLVLRDLEDLSYRELSEVLDIPIGTVMSRLSRARQAIRAVLLEEPCQPAARAPSREGQTASGARARPIEEDGSGTWT